MNTNGKRGTFSQFDGRMQKSHHYFVGIGDSNSAVVDCFFWIMWASFPGGFMILLCIFTEIS